MKHSSLLLHALSLNDRILEPNELPVAGHVWAYNKTGISREEFVGNCMSMLSLLGIQDAEISWKDNIMAFDVSRNGQPVTVIISLQDDSLASDYFYFLGIWVCSDSASLLEQDLGDPSLWQEEGLLAPAMNYSVSVAAEPMLLPAMQDAVGGEMFAQRLYEDTFYLCGLTEAYPVPSGSFVICPTTHAANQSSQEIRHALYSLRNLMALMAGVMRIYDDMCENNASSRVYSEQLALMKRMDQKVAAAEWDALVRENSRISFELASGLMNCRKLENETRSLRRLFDSILNELDIHDMQGLPSLISRMLVPFELIEDMFEERFNMIESAEKQSGLIQPMMHARMLASQQVLLEKLVADKTGDINA